tara:strand:+ start:94 stop:396 length:303 start_codon:yes stop_codon:yes gene_type:complete
MSDKLVTKEKTNWTAVNAATDSTIVAAGPCVLVGLFVNTVLSAHTVVIQDNATPIVTLPASTAAGTYYQFDNLVCNHSLVMNPNDSSTGNVTVMYKDLQS